VAVIGNFVRHVRELPLERQGLSPVFFHAIDHLARQIEPRKIRIAVFEELHDPQALAVVLEISVAGHHLRQGEFAGVAERAVSQIVGQAHRFDQVFVQTEDPADGPRDLGDLQRMGKPGTVMVPFVVDEDLGFILKPAERRRVKDAVAVSLESRPELMFLLGMTPPAAVFRLDGVGGQFPRLPLLHLRPLDHQRFLPRFAAARARCAYRASSDCEMTLVPAVTAMKLVSPVQRGTM
jgi:hypothetical protein